MYETILFEKGGGVANVALNRPKKLNAFDGTMHEELYDALEVAASDDEVRCVVLRVEGKGFSAGADLAQIVEGADGEGGAGSGEERGGYDRGERAAEDRADLVPHRGP